MAQKQSQSSIFPTQLPTWIYITIFKIKSSRLWYTVMTCGKKITKCCRE